MKKSQEISKGKKENSLTTSQKKQRDSEIMQQKQKAANEKAVWTEKNDDSLENQSFAARCIISSMTKILWCEQSLHML